MMTTLFIGGSNPISSRNLNRTAPEAAPQEDSSEISWSSVETVAQGAAIAGGAAVAFAFGVPAFIGLGIGGLVGAGLGAVSNAVRNFDIYGGGDMDLGLGARRGAASGALIGAGLGAGAGVGAVAGVGLLGAAVVGGASDHWLSVRRTSITLSPGNWLCHWLRTADLRLAASPPR